MLRPQLHHHYQTSTPVVLFPKPFFHGNIHTRLPVFPKSSSAKTKEVRAGKIKATATEMKEEKFIWQSKTKVKVLVTVKKPDEALWPYGIAIKLVSSGSEMKTVLGYAGKKDEEEDEVRYEADVEVPFGFGEIGAIYVDDIHTKEMFIKSIQISNLHKDNLNFVCNSWVQPFKPRPFFTAKSYLPSETPDGLKQARKQDLKIYEEMVLIYTKLSSIHAKSCLKYKVSSLLAKSLTRFYYAGAT